MPIKPLSRSILALAIAAASLHSHAATYQIEEGPKTWSNQSITDGLSITGSNSVTQDAIVLNGGTQVQGNLQVNADITVTSPEQADGIQLDNSTLSGDLIHEKSLSVSGDYIHGIAIYAGSELNGLSNTGSIMAQGTTAPGDPSNLSEAEGITVDTSLIHGDLSNRGDIRVSAYEASGIALHAYAGSTELARIDGDLINSGTITSTALGGQGSTAAGIVVAHGQISGGLNNSGTITASGTDSAGIYVEDARIVGDIVNSGTIKGDRVGIYLNRGLGSAFDTPVIENSGLISGGEYAIYSEGSTPSRLRLAGGTIRGDLSGIAYIDVIGDATFDGARIDALQYGGVDIYNADDSPLRKPGSLTLTQAHVDLQGYLEMNEGTVLRLSLSDATDPSRAILTVRDDAYFSPQSTVDLVPTSDAFRANGKNYTLIKAGTLELDEDLPRVINSSALLNIDKTWVSDDTLFTTVTSKSSTQAGQLIDDAGGSSNAGNAFDPFYADVMKTLNDSDRLFQAFANADQQQLAALSEQLAPQVDGALQAATHSANNLVSSAVGSRTSALRGASSGSAFNESGFWIQGHDSDMRQGRRSGVAGYDADSQGLSLGLDGKLSEQWTLGMAYSNLETKVSGRNGNKTDIDSQILTLYSGFEQGNAFVDASLSYGFHDNTSKRDIAGTRAKGDFDSQSLALNLEAGYGLHSGNLTLEPRVAARYSQLDIDSYRESGSSAALRVSGQRYEVIELGAGARLAGNFEFAQGRLEPELKLMAYHDFAADRASSTSSFVLGGSPFVTHGARPARDSYEASLGASYSIGALSLGASYDYTGRSGFDADTLRANVRYDF